MVVPRMVHLPLTVLCNIVRGFLLYRKYDNMIKEVTLIGYSY